MGAPVDPLFTNFMFPYEPEFYFCNCWVGDIEISRLAKAWSWLVVIRGRLVLHAAGSVMLFAHECPLGAY